MNKKYIAAVVSSIALISALTGAYAFFTDTEHINLTAHAAKLGITVDTTNFSDDLIRDMIPGDSRDLSYTVQNNGEVDAKVFTEITLISSVPMADYVEWFIQDANESFNDEDRRIDIEQFGKDYYNGFTINDLEESKIKFLSLTNRNKVAKFVVNNGVLKAGEEGNISKVDLKLMLGLNAGNSFMDSVCDVYADVYAIQNENTDESITWDFIKDIAEVNESIELQ